MQYALIKTSIIHSLHMTKKHKWGNKLQYMYDEKEIHTSLRSLVCPLGTKPP